MPNKTNSKARRGVVAIEFAMTAPLLLLLLLGALELGHANMVFNVAEAAAYEAAREGIVPGATADECRAAAQRILDISRIKGAEIKVTPKNLNKNTDDVQVSITVPYRLNTVVAPLFTKKLTMQRSCVLTREQL